MSHAYNKYSSINIKHQEQKKINIIGDEAKNLNLKIKSLV